MQTTQLKVIHVDNTGVSEWEKNFSVIMGKNVNEKENIVLPLSEEITEQPQEPLPHFLPAPLNSYIKAPVYDFF